MLPHTRLGQGARQGGAALVVGLILMLVLTVLGVSGMTMSVSGLTMASNAQVQQNAFQAAETGIDLVIGQRNFVTTGPVSVGPLALGNGMQVAATQTFQANTLVPPLARGFSFGSMEAFHFDVVSVGNGPDNAQSTHNQSFFVIGPAN